VTLADIQWASYRRLNYADSPPPDVSLRMTQWINIWHQRLLTLPGVDSLRDTTLSFSSAIGQTQYALPDGLARIRKIYEVTSPRVLRQEQWAWIREYDPQLLAAGVPDVYAFVSYKAVKAQPSTAQIWAVSTNGGDTQQITVGGFSAAGERLPPITVSLAGTAPVLVSSSFIREIDRVFLSAPAVGTVELMDTPTVATGKPLLYILPGKTSTRYQWIQLWPTPASALTYYVDCQRNLDPLALAMDEPLLPPEFHWLLVEAACFEEWLRKGDPRAATAKAEIDTGVKAMRHWVWSLPDYQPSNAAQGDRPSRLGGQYPAW